MWKSRALSVSSTILIIISCFDIRIKYFWTGFKCKQELYKIGAVDLGISYVFKIVGNKLIWSFINVYLYKIINFEYIKAFVNSHPKWILLLIFIYKIYIAATWNKICNTPYSQTYSP